MMNNKITLHPVKVDAAGGRYYDWLRDIEVTRFLECRFNKYSVDDLVEYIRSHPNLFAVCLDGRHIGNVKLDINSNHKTAVVGIMIGEKDCWGKGYGTKAIRLISKKAFGMGLKKLNAGCYANNESSIKMFLRAGYRIEGILKSQYICDGKRIDKFMFGCTVHDLADK